MMVSTRILIKTDFDKDNNKCFFCAANQHIIMISDRSCDRLHFKYIQIENIKT